MDSQLFAGNTSKGKVTIIEGSGTLANTNYSTSSTATERVYDNTENLFTNAHAVLSCSFSLAPDDQSFVYLVEVGQEIDGTNNVAAPGATDIKGGKVVGSFKIYDTTDQQYQQTVVSLFGIRKAKYAIYNEAGQTMDADFVVTLEGLSLYAK